MDMPSLSSPLSHIFSTSPLEKLPLELVSGILEYAPECVLKTRAASHAMRWHVAEYSMRHTNVLIARHLRVYHATKLVEVHLTVPNAARKLFELRLLGNSSLFSQTTRDKIKDEGDKIGGESANNNSHQYPDEETRKYTIYLTKENEGSVEHFSDCIGKSLEKVEVIDWNELPFYSTITNLLEGKQFGHLEVKFETLSHLAINELLRPLKDCTNQISLSVKNVTAYNPERFLLELSALFRSIRINQLYIPELGFSKFFFGRHDFDWSPTILEMFSGKMDSLYISNFHYPQYLSAASAATLLKKLTLSQKRLWFTATMWNVIKTTTNDDDFLTEADGHYLKIIHRSRQDE